MTEVEESVPEEIEEIVPTDPVGPVVPVSVENPVRVQQLPSRSGVPRSLNIKVAETLIGHDLRRRVLRIFLPSLIVAEAETNFPIRLGNTQQSVEDGTGFLLSVGVVLELTHADTVWAISTATGPDEVSVVSLMTENWAD